MGVPVVAQCVADPKPLAQTWAMRSRSTLFQHTRCYFNTVEDTANRQGKCLFHPRMSCCKLPSISLPDIVVAGLSCKPFSLQRGDRSKTLPQDHESFQVVLVFFEVSGHIRCSGRSGGGSPWVRFQVITTAVAANIILHDDAGILGSLVQVRVGGQRVQSQGVALKQRFIFRRTAHKDSHFLKF